MYFNLESRIVGKGVKISLVIITVDSEFCVRLPGCS